MTSFDKDSVFLRPGECWVNEVERLFAFEIAQQHPNVRSALDKIADDLTKNGLLFMQHKQVLSVSFKFEEQIKRHWIPCMRLAVFTIAAQGVLPLHTYTDRKTGQSITVCPHPETYKLSIRYEKGAPVMRFWWINTIPDKPPFMDTVDPKVEIITGFGYDPSRNGSLNSLVSTLFPTMNFIDSMLTFATRAEERNSDPTMIVQQTAAKAANLESASENVPYNFFVDCDSVEKREEDMYDRQDLEARLGRHEVRAQLDAIEAQKTQLGVAQRLITTNLLNRLTLKEGQSIGSQVLPHPRGDLVNLINISKETVSQVFKIPQEVFSGKVLGHTAEGTASIMMTQYRETLRTWARFLDPIVTLIYKKMYEKYDALEFNRIIDKRLQSLLPQLVDKLSEIRVIINFSQGLTTSEMEYAVNRGLLDYSIMAKFWLTQNGLPKELLANEEDILSDQTKRELLLGRTKRKQTETETKKDREDVLESKRRKTREKKEDKQ